MTEVINRYKEFKNGSMPDITEISNVDLPLDFLYRSQSLNGNEAFPLLSFTSNDCEP